MNVSIIPSPLLLSGQVQNKSISSTWSKGESSRRHGEGMFVLDGTVDSKGNKEEKTREVANNRMYHFGCNKDVICCDEWVMLVVLLLGEGVIILLVLLLLEPKPEQLSSLVGAVMTV